jgi:hypothetical protein
VDDEVEAVHDSIIAANLSMPPIAIAPAHHAIFVQKYLESYPFSAVIALAPLPPSPAPVLQRWLSEARLERAASASGSSMTAEELKKAIAYHLGEKSPFLSDVHLLQVLSLVGNSVNLEPQPVSMLMVAPPLKHMGTAGLLHAQDVQQSLDLHELDAEDEEQVLSLRSCGSSADVDACVRALWGLGSTHQAEAVLQERVALEASERIMEWIQARY